MLQALFHVQIAFSDITTAHCRGMGTGMEGYRSTRLGCCRPAQSGGKGHHGTPSSASKAYALLFSLLDHMLFIWHHTPAAAIFKSFKAAGRIAASILKSHLPTLHRRIGMPMVWSACALLSFPPGSGHSWRQCFWAYVHQKYGHLASEAIWMWQ